MRQIADFHIHSRYSRACSRDLELSKIEAMGRKKGIDIIGTGDFTFPDWFSSINDELEEIGRTGLYKLKARDDDAVKFTLTTEVALIYKKAGKCRRIHLVAHAPSVKAVAELNKNLDKDYNIRSDGRPILGMSIEEFCRLCFSIDPLFLVYPAHIWTPWFAIFGSKSGFDSWEEAFGEYAGRIFAYETGLSSDPEMNWRLPQLDSFTLLSNSDAHSLPNLAREANVFELAQVSYEEIYEVIKNKKTTHGSFLDFTLEFFPEEGMYHWDGHRDCGFCSRPEETRKFKGLCPKCGKPLTLGVEYRVSELAKRPAGFKPEGAPGFKKLVELDKIIAEAMGVKNRQAKKVQAGHEKILKALGKELDVLLNVDISKIREIAGETIARGIEKVRKGELLIEPGYDGSYGIVKIFKEEDIRAFRQEKLL